MKAANILCAAHAVPEQVVTNDMLSRMVDTSDAWITSRTGIKNRHLSTGENTSDLCARVVKSLLAKSGLAPTDIDLLIVGTVSPDYLTPSTACLTQEKSGLTQSIAFDLSAACSGFVYGLSIAQKFIATGACRHAIVIGAETLSKLVDWQDRSSCVIFADGAGGVLLGSCCDGGGILCEDLHSDGRGAMAISARHMPVHSPFAEGGADVNTALTMNGRDVFDFATRAVPGSIRTLMEKANMAVEDIDLVVPHQANARIVEIVARKLKLPMEKFYLNIHDVGNTSAASIPIALSEMIEAGAVAIGSGKLLVLTGFGGGLTWGSILIRI